MANRCIEKKKGGGWAMEEWKIFVLQSAERLATEQCLQPQSPLLWRSLKPMDVNDRLIFDIKVRLIN